MKLMTGNSNKPLAAAIADYDALEAERAAAQLPPYRFMALLRAEGDVDVALTARETDLKTLEWERIHETLAETGFNISETARRLGMHRRTLARKLGKQRVK